MSTRIGVIDVVIARYRRTLDKLVDQLAKVETDALIEVVDRRTTELEGMTRTLSQQRDLLLAGPGEGLTDAEPVATRGFVEAARFLHPEAMVPSLVSTTRCRGFVAAFVQTQRGCCWVGGTVSGSNGRREYR